MITRTRFLALAVLALLVAYAIDGPKTAPSTNQAATASASVDPSFSGDPEPVPRIAIAYDEYGRDSAFSALAREGVQRVVTYFEAELQEVTAKADDTDADREARLRRLGDAGNGIVFVIGSAYAGALAKVAPAYPDTWFAFVDDGSVDAQNVVGILFNEEQGAFLVGAAAALTSKTGNVGFVGMTGLPRLGRYEAGFAAGARAADPEVKVRVAYIPMPLGNAGPGGPTKAQEAALRLYDAGVDVIFAAADDAADGVIQAAYDRGRWAIGADDDRYQTADPSVRDAILTSMLKRADAGTYTIGMEMGQSVAKDGNNVFGVGRDGVGYATSGGFVDAIKPQLDAFAARIASGEILVPTKP